MYFRLDKQNRNKTLGAILRLVLVMAVFIGSSMARAVTVDGYCLLNCQQNHSASKVLFIQVSPSAMTDSVYTDATGHFIANLVAGIYDVRYEHAGYDTLAIAGRVLTGNTTLGQVELVQVLSGTLTGTLSACFYHVIGPISVQVGDTLRIQPGARLQFEGPYGFDVYGQLTADGTMADSISFYSNITDVSLRWRGLRFHASGPIESTLRYCMVANAGNVILDPNLYGGGVFLDGSTGLSMQNCVLRGNAAVYGGGLHCRNARLVMKDCFLTMNTAQNQGGGLYSTESEIRADSCLISGNSAERGGGIYATASQCSLATCVLSENQASSLGGGLFLDNTPCWLLSDTLSGNGAVNGSDAKGGALYGINSELEILRCVVADNNLYGSGGGIYCSASQVSILGTVFGGNACWNNYENNYGGALHCVASDLAIDSSLFGENSATYGGGISADACNTVITNSNFTSNTASRSHRSEMPPIYGSSAGGALFQSGGNSDVNNCRFEGNHAVIYGNHSPVQGGAICAISGLQNYSLCSFDSNWTWTELDTGNPRYGTTEGGAVACFDSLITFRECVFRDNWASGYSWISRGGAVYSVNKPSFYSCLFQSNSTTGEGGGVYGDARLYSCVFVDNVAVTGGGAAGAADLQLCTLYRNRADRGGACSTSGDIRQCTIVENSATSGGGILCESSTLVVTSSVIVYSEGSGIHYAGNGSENSVMQYCDSYGNTSGDITFADDNTDLGPPSIGSQLVSNSNGDSADIYLNIFADPLFADTALQDYHVPRESPCVDAGNPSIPPDSDGTIADIGAFFYDQRQDMPLPFSLWSPSSGAVCTSLDTSLIWYGTNDPNPDQIPLFNVWLDTRWDLRTKWQIGDSLADTTFALGGLQDDRTYYWTVMATDVNTHGRWASDTLMFHTYRPDPPLAFGLVHELPGDTCWSLDTSLAWDSSSDPDPLDTTRYDLWLDTLADFSTKWLAADSVSDTTIALNELLDDHEYYWTVRATDSNTPGTWADDTSMFRTYQRDAPLAFCLTSPANNATLPTGQALVTWSASGDMDPGDYFVYVVEWTTDTSFSFCASATTTDTSFLIIDLSSLATQKAAFRSVDSKSQVRGSRESLDDLPDDITVHWRVKAVDSYGLVTWANNDSSGWSVNISISDAPLPFSLVSPISGDTCWSLDTLLVWQASTDPDPQSEVRYDVWLDSLSDMSTKWIIADSTADTSVVLSELQDDRAYYWIVRATDSNTPGTWASDTLLFRTYQPEPPTGFVQLSPPNGSTHQIANVSVIWTTAYDPDPGDFVFYTVQWSDSSGFFPAFSAVTQDTTFIISDMISLQRNNGNSWHGSGQLDDLPDDITLYWRVKATDQYGIITWANEDTTGWVFHIGIPDPPEPFDLSSPIDGDTSWTSPTVVRWQSTTDLDPQSSVRYDIWLDSLPDMSTKWIVADSSIADTTFNLINLLDNHSYFWTVRATDDNTAGTWASDTGSFCTYYPEAPQPFTRVSPANGATLQVADVPVNWTTASDLDPGDSVQYTVQWSQSLNFSPVFSSVTSDTSFVISDLAALQSIHGHDLRSRDQLDELPDNITLYWRVKAVDSFDLTTWANGDTTGWMFHVGIPEPPLPFDLLLPANGSVLSTYPIALSWEQTADPDPGSAVRFDVIIDTIATLATATVIADSIPGTAYSISGGLLDDHTYYWTVRATDVNTAGTWASDTSMFRTAFPQAPGAFVLASPTNGNVITTTTVNLCWHASHDPDPDNIPYYDVWLDTLSTFGTDWQIADGIADTTFSVNGLLDDHLYYWTVRATDNNTAGTWSSDSLSFIMSYLPESPSPFNLLSPLDSTVENAYPIQLTWQTSADPDFGDIVGYDVYIDTSLTMATKWLIADSILEGQLSITDDLLEDYAYYWTVRATDSNTPGTWATDTLSFIVDMETAADDPASLIPSDYYFAQNYPNPFNPTTHFEFGLPKNANVKIAVYDLLGREVSVLVNSPLSAGRHQISWECRTCPSGMYLVAMSAAGNNIVRKVTLLK